MLGSVSFFFLAGGVEQIDWPEEHEASDLLPPREEDGDSCSAITATR